MIKEEIGSMILLSIMLVNKDYLQLKTIHLSIGFRVHPRGLNLINTQITRVFSDSFQLYLGVENLTNYRQKNTILGSDDPFGDYFDATYIYGPIFGRMSYVGLRYYIN